MKKLRRISIEPRNFLRLNLRQYSDFGRDRVIANPECTDSSYLSDIISNPSVPDIVVSTPAYIDLYRRESFCTSRVGYRFQI